MRATPYLFFDNACAEAFRFYERVLNGRIEFMQTYGESPAADQVDPAWKDLVMHAFLVAQDVQLMASDSSPGQHRPAGGTHIALEVDSDEEAERIFGELADGGQVTMPLETTFFASRFGSLIDRFGTPWMVSSGDGE